jgi:FkbM family methyltransferase
MTGGVVPRQSTTCLGDAKDVVNFIWTHPANENQRVRALLRAASFQARARILGKRKRARLGQSSVIWAELHRTSAAKVVYANPPDHPEMLVWQRALRPGYLFIDVGANVGSYTIWAGDLGAEVIALEPAADTFSLLMENIALNGYPVDAIQAAAGAECGTARFTAGLDSVNRLDPAGRAETAVVTIDSVIGNRTAAGMKVDVEGFELDVLVGCAQALAEHRLKLIQLEWNATSQRAVGTDRRPVADLLTRHGYGLYRPDRSGVLVPIADTGFGPDIFARPVPHEEPGGRHAT